MNIFLDDYFNNSPAELVKLLIDENLLKATDLHQFFEIKATVIPTHEKEEESDLSDFIKNITASKKKKKKKEKDEKKKDKKKKK